MTKQIYEDYKYFIQDTGYFYVGSKYTLQEITECEDILFKFRKVVAESIIPKYTNTDTLETVLYYLEKESFVFILDSRFSFVTEWFSFFTWYFVQWSRA